MGFGAFIDEPKEVKKAKPKKMIVDSSSSCDESDDAQNSSDDQMPEILVSHDGEHVQI